MLRYETMQQAYGMLVPNYNEGISRVPFEQRPDNARGMSEEISLGLKAAQFFTGGRNIFRLSDGLRQALQRTTLEGVRVKDILLPHKTFFVSLIGSDVGSLPGAPNVIDGAYVVAPAPGMLEITITSRRLDVNAASSRNWPFNRDVCFYLPFELKGDDNPTFDEAIERAIATKDILVAPNDMRADEAPSATEHDGFPDLDGLHIPVPWRDMKAVLDHRAAISNRDALPNVKRALSLVVNALAWLTCEPADALAASELPTDVPVSLVEQFRAVSSKGARQRAEATLLDRGFARIRILGSTIEPLIRTTAGGGYELDEAHWRIGHWRRQPYGPQSSLRRIRWIRPTLVRPDLELNPDRGGHDYIVGPA